MNFSSMYFFKNSLCFRLWHLSYICLKLGWVEKTGHPHLYQQDREQREMTQGPPHPNPPPAFPRKYLCLPCVCPLYALISTYWICSWIQREDFDLWGWTLADCPRGPAGDAFITVLIQLLRCVQLFCNLMDHSPPGFSVHWISQARILEWVAISFSKGSCPNPGIKLVSPALAGRFFTAEPPGKPWCIHRLILKKVGSLF